MITNFFKRFLLNGARAQANPDSHKVFSLVWWSCIISRVKASAMAVAGATGVLSFSVPPTPSLSAPGRLKRGDVLPPVDGPAVHPLRSILSQGSFPHWIQLPRPQTESGSPLQLFVTPSYSLSLTWAVELRCSVRSDRAQWSDASTFIPACADSHHSPAKY